MLFIEGQFQRSLSEPLPELLQLNASQKVNLVLEQLCIVLCMINKFNDSIILKFNFILHLQ